MEYTSKVPFACPYMDQGQIKTAAKYAMPYMFRCLFIFQKYLGDVALTENSNSYLSDTSWVPEV